MEILVCIKQVPEVSKIKIDYETGNLIRDGVPGIINPQDLSALTEAVKLKEKTGGRVTVVSMSPPGAKDAIKECILRGADRGYLVIDGKFRGSDTLATSYTLAMAIKYIGEFDIVFTGTQTLDGDTGQVGPEIGERLGINQVTYVKNVDLDGEVLLVEKVQEEGIEKIEVKLPALISVVKGQVEKVSKEDIEKVEAEIEELSAEKLGLDDNRIGNAGSPTVVSSTFSPEEVKLGTFLEGTPKEMVAEMVEILLSKKLIG